MALETELFEVEAVDLQLACIKITDLNSSFVVVVAAAEPPTVVVAVELTVVVFEIAAAVVATVAAVDRVLEQLNRFDLFETAVVAVKVAVVDSVIEIFEVDPYKIKIDFT